MKVFSSFVLTSAVVLLTCYVNADVNNMWREYMEDYYSSYYKPKDIKEIKNAGSTNPLVNIQGLATQSRIFYKNLIKTSGENVFKVKFLEEVIIVADPIALRALYDVKKIEKENDLLLAKFNEVLLKNEPPSMTTNDLLHKKQKMVQMRFLYNRVKNFPLEKMFEVFKNEINRYQPISGPGAESIDFDVVWENITIDAVTTFLLGEPLRDTALFNSFWKHLIITKDALLTTPDDTDADEISIANRVLQRLRGSPIYEKEIKALRKHSNFSQDRIDQQIIFFVYFLVVGGLRKSIPQAVANFQNLNPYDRRRIMKEADRFFESIDDDGDDDDDDDDDSNYGYGYGYHSNDGHKDINVGKKIGKLRWIERFAVETMRYLPVATQVFVRARRDFILVSSSGYYSVKKGQRLVGMVYAAQRDEETFSSPEKFKITRRQSHVKRNFYAFGGPYHQKPKPTNRKCLGQQLSLAFLKIVTLHLTRCKTEPANDWTFTDTNGQRVITTDNPMKVKSFTCKNSS